MRDRIHDVQEISAFTLRARRMEIVDDSGNPRAKLYTADDGTPVVALYDRAMKRRLCLTLNDDDMPSIALLAPNEPTTPSISMRIENDVPELRIHDKSGRLRSVLYVDENRPALNLYDQRERLRLALYLEPSGAATVAVFDENEGPKVIAGGEED